MPMQNLLLYTLLILASAGLILGAHRIWQRFPLPFVRVFFIFIALYSAFNFLSIISKVFYASLSHERVGLFSLLAAVILFPFLIGILYSYLLLSEQLVEKPYPKWSKMAFWMLHGTAFLWFLFTVSLIAEAGFSHSRSLVVSAYILFAVFSLLIPSAMMAFRAQSGSNRITVSLSRYLGRYFLIAFTLAPLLIEFFHTPFRLFSSLSGAYLSIFILMALLPVPPMVFLSVYLKRHRGFFFIDEAAMKGIASRMQDLSLTPRERDIVLLVVQGRTNEEIGDCLFISTKTVKNNLTEIFRKTRVRNRVQLTGLLLGRDE